MKTVYEIVRIKQVIKEVEASEKFTVRSPEDAAKVASEFIGDEDRALLLFINLFYFSFSHRKVLDKS